MNQAGWREPPQRSRQLPCPTSVCSKVSKQQGKEETRLKAGAESVPQGHHRWTSTCPSVPAQDTSHGLNISLCPWEFSCLKETCFLISQSPKQKPAAPSALSSRPSNLFQGGVEEPHVQSSKGGPGEALRRCSLSPPWSGPRRPHLSVPCTPPHDQPTRPAVVPSAKPRCSSALQPGMSSITSLL